MKIKRINESLDDRDLNDILSVVKHALNDSGLDQLKNDLTKEHTILADQHRVLDGFAGDCWFFFIYLAIGTTSDNYK